MNRGLITQARTDFHANLTGETGPLCLIRDGSEILTASNADKDQKSSRSIATHIAMQLNAKTRFAKPAGQSMGSQFERAVQHFLFATLPALESVRPGPWVIENFGGSRRIDHLSEYFRPTYRSLRLAQN